MRRATAARGAPGARAGAAESRRRGTGAMATQPLSMFRHRIPSRAGIASRAPRHARAVRPVGAAQTVPAGVVSRTAPDAGRGLRRPRRGGRIPALLAAALAALLGACTFDYGGDPGPEQLADEVPETVLTGATHTVVRNGRVVAEIRARQIENFPGGGRAVLSDVRYVEYDGSGRMAATGRADRAVYYTESEDAEVAGAVELRSVSQEASLTAEELHWDHAGRLLSTGPDQVVAVIRDDGSRVHGAGFEAELRAKTIHFSGPVSGRLVAETAADE